MIASLVDPGSASRLRSWMWDGADPVLRVNAAGILAKVHGNDTATDIATVLDGDPEVRELYMTAVLSRVCALDWSAAKRLATDPRSVLKKAAFVASSLAEEVLNPRDFGARWCSATMLRELSPLL